MDERLAERLEEARAALADVESRLADPDIDPAEYADLGRRHASLRVVVELHQAWARADTDRREARELAEADPDMAAELTALAEERARECARLEGAIRRELVPKDPDDERDAILEIRAAAGGSEAAIWAGDLARMYERYAERHDLTVEWLETSEGDAGGFAKATFAVKGRGAYGLTRHEAGVHRVQRVPKTESQGRIHTSTATVAVLPEVDQVEMEVDPNDVRVDVFRSSGPGGQSVNTTDSAVRLTHLPTGTVVSCQDEKSQLQNKEKAFRILRARLYRMEEERRRAELAGVRRTQVGGGERAEKIRTYNFKENRVTDHRLERTVYRLDQVLDGDLDELVRAMMETEAAEALSSGS